MDIKSLATWRSIFLACEGGLLILSGLVLWWSPYWSVHQLVAWAYLVMGLGLGMGWTGMRVWGKRQIDSTEKPHRIWQSNWLPYLIPALFVFFWLVFYISAE